MKIHQVPDNQHISEHAGCGLQTLKAGNDVQTVEIINKHILCKLRRKLCYEKHSRRGERELGVMWVKC